VTQPHANGTPAQPDSGAAEAPWCALALGSNLGDRGGYLAGARAAIEARFACRLRASRIYETEPVGPPGQPRYLNQAVLLRAPADPETMLAALLEIEERLGRCRAAPWGPRTIDIDLLLWGDRVHRGPRAIVPHPRLHDRPFVLVPLAELLPDWRHPVRNTAVREMLAACGRRGVRAWNPAAGTPARAAEQQGEG
jgi:2-amino-4-hydroxy-6-hydroxymethyldihydropteridine diphosphokinase